MLISLLIFLQFSSLFAAVIMLFNNYHLNVPTFFNFTSQVIFIYMTHLHKARLNQSASQNRVHQIQPTTA